MWDALWRNGKVAAMTEGPPAFGLIERGAIAAQDGRIAWIGHESSLPADGGARAVHDLGGRLLTPGLVDCHNHAVYYGDALAALSSYESQVLPKHVYEGKEFTTNPAINAPIGTGPFIFKEWKKGDFIRLEKNPHYWDKGKPYLDAIVVRIIPDAAARAAALEKGEVQLGVFNPVPLSDVKRLTALPSVKAETRGYEYFAPMYMMEVNLREGPLKDKRVRHAIMQALDRKFVADNIWFGFARPATGPLVSSSPFYTKEGVPQYAYDPARANAILDEAGFKRGAGNVRFKVSLTFPPVQPEIPRTAEYIKQALGRVGIDVELTNIDIATFIRQVYNWEFELTQNYLLSLNLVGEGLNDAVNPRLDARFDDG